MTLSAMPYPLFTGPRLREAVTMAYRLAAALAMCMALSGCFFLPGKFTSHLDLRRDGTFTNHYAGELVFAFPEQAGSERWNLGSARCYKGDSDEERPCADTELDNLRARFIADRALREEQAAEIADIIGRQSVGKGTRYASRRHQVSRTRFVAPWQDASGLWVSGCPGPSIRDSAEWCTRMALPLFTARWFGFA